MKISVLAAAAALLMAAAVGAAAEASSPVPLRRFALVVGSNAGAPGQVKLKYAASDARSFARVMEELGGVKQGDLTLLVDPDAAGLRLGIRRVQDAVSAPRPQDERRELVIYYSGHSDDEGLILGSGTYRYDEFRSSINAIPADVRVAILDSCSSGSLTRAKGGVQRPAFLFDASTDTKGHAFLTSSSAEEASQESDRIGASFFTHYLVSGLRGAADVTGDGVVTLNEAYAYAFQETLASTEKTQYGPQHPAYDIGLTGSGDLVLTDLRAASAGLTVSEEVAGRLYIRDTRGVLAVEVNKLPGQRVDLGLEPGTYGVVLDNKGARSKTELTIAAGGRTVLTSAGLAPFSADRTVARGEFDTPEWQTDRFPTEQFALSFVPDIINGILSPRANRSVSINALVGTSANLRGFELGGLVNIESETMRGFQAAGIANAVLGEADGFQAAGVLNFGGRDVRFFQAAGVVNVVGGAMDGFQAAGVGNVNLADARGFGSGGAFDFVRGTASGFRAAGAGVIAMAGMQGVQMAGAFAAAGGPSAGLQLSGAVNVCTDLLTGVQIAGAGNYAREINGPQISVVNVSESVNGAQIGVVNIAGSVRGTQVGLLNFARVIDGVPIGLLTFEQAGRQALEVWWDGGTLVRLGFKLGSRYTYTLFSGGVDWASSPVRWSYGLGFGGHLPTKRVWVDFDVSVLSLHTGSTDWYISTLGNMLPQARVELGLPIFGLTLNAGVAVDMYVPVLSSEPDGSPTTVFHMAPRVIAGVHL
jgi:hypothetical protein